MCFLFYYTLRANCYKYYKFIGPETRKPVGKTLVKHLLDL